jgi:hypothetical protein
MPAQYSLTSNTIYGKIADIKATISTLTGEGEGTIGEMIDGAIENVIGNNGELEKEDSSTIYDINREIDRLDTSVNSILNN